MMPDKPDHKTRVLIVSPPGMMQNVLRKIFSGRDLVKVVGVANGCLSALGMIPDRQPDLVVIDSNLPETETSQLILQIRQSNPLIQSLLLVETTQQYKIAANSGADFTLHAYTLPDSLGTVFASLKSHLSGP